MKYLFTFLLLVCLYGCTGSSGMNGIGKVKKCCACLSFVKSTSSNTACIEIVPEPEPVPVVTFTAFERNGMILTW